TVSFVVNTEHPELFAQAPAISSAGTLTYTPAPSVFGDALVTVVARDNGGTNFGGYDTSPPCSFICHIRDCEPPTISCPTDMLVECSKPSGTVVFFDVPAHDNSGVATVQCQPPSGAAFALGTSQVLCQAFDPSNNMSQCTFSVTVLSRVPPRIQTAGSSMSG